MGFLSGMVIFQKTNFLAGVIRKRICTIIDLKFFTACVEMHEQLNISEHAVNLACLRCQQRLIIVHGNGKLKVIDQHRK